MGLRAWLNGESRLTVESASEKIAEAIYNASVEGLELVKDITATTEWMKVPDADSQRRVLAEFQFVFLHALSRIAFLHLSQPQRDLLHESVFQNICRVHYVDRFFSKAPEEERGQVADWYLATTNARELEYGRLKGLLTPPDERAGDYVAWVFGARIGEIVGQPQSFIVTESVYIYVAETMIEQGWNKLFERMRWD